MSFLNLPHRIFRHTELHDVYLSESIKSVAASFTGVFAPIFLLHLGYSFQEVLLYFLVESILRILLSPLCGQMVVRFGPKLTLAASYFAGFVLGCLFAVLPQYHLPILLLAALSAVAQNLHWLPFQVLFSKVSHDKSAARETGMMDILFSLASALGPLLGGIIAMQLGLPFLFWITPVILIFGISPLLRIGGAKGEARLNYHGVARRMRRDLVSAFGFGIDVGSGVLWPLFIYLVLQTYVSIGFITTLGVIIGIFMTVVVARLADRHGSGQLLALGVTGAAITHLLRGVVSTFGAITMVGLSGGIFRTIFAIPYGGQYYKHASAERRIEYVVYMEIAGDLGRAVYFGLLLIAAYMLPVKSVLILGFVIAAAAVLLSASIQPHAKTQS